MEILILANSDGGLYKFRQELIEELVKKNAVICCIPNEDGYIDKLKRMGCMIIRTPINRRGMNPLEDLKLLILYRRIIIDKKPDVVLTYTIKPNVYGGVACQLTNTPYISNVTGLGTSIENGGIISKIALTLYRIGISKSNCVFFQNKNNRQIFIDNHVVHGKTRTIPGSGVNLNTYPAEPYPDDGDEFRFLFVGRIMKDKGINELFGALKQLHDDGFNATLDMVGGCDEDYMELLNQYEQQGLIRYHDRQDDVHKYYKLAHCVTLPSYHEGMANVLLEAASTTRPVIASRIPGCQETFDEDITGIGCESRDTSSLLQAMRKMYKLSNDVRKQMGLKGREKVKKEFDRQIVVDAYIDEIDKATQ